MTENSNDKSQRSRYGPHGVGDPDDMTLRKMEINVVIPQYRREIVKNEKCTEEIEKYTNCVLAKGMLTAPLTCRSEKIALNECLEFWNEDEEIYVRAKKKYLEDRAEYRRTGLTKDNIQIVDQYLEEKKKAEEELKSNMQNNQPS